MPRCASLLVVALTLAALPARATLLKRAFGLRELVSEAAVVVRGEVVSVESRFGEDGQRIYSYAKIRPIETIKGVAGADITVKFLGGRVGDVEMSVVGSPRFAAGEKVVLFLRTDGALHYVVAMSLGKYTVTTRDSGETVSRDPADDSAAGRETYDAFRKRILDEVSRQAAEKKK